MATPVANTVPLTGNPQIDGLVQGSAWQFAAARVLTYSFSLNDGPSDPTWTQYPAAQQAVVQALQAWSNVANITFQETSSGIVFTQSSADLALMLISDSTAPIAGIGLFPDPVFADAFLAADGQYTRATFPHPEGDIVYNVGSSVMNPAFGQMNPGGYGYEVVLHEIGHALGLKHPGDAGGNGRPTFSELGISSFSNGNYTLMSNNDTAQPTDPFHHESTPMPLDILAIQRIYGANTSYHTGNDSYILEANGTIRTVWDAGGVDVIDASRVPQFAPGVSIDLAPGHFSTTTTSTLAIAYGVTIENAVGGGGNDVISGNDADNRIDGRFGTDTMSGGNGNDTYVVENLGDLVIENAGQGIDTVESSVSYTLAANVENLVLTNFGTGIHANGTGNDLDNAITGDSGNNVLAGNGGNDRLSGGAGNDSLIGGSGNDLLDGGTGSDTLAGGIGDDLYIIDSYATLGGPTSLRLQSEPGDYIGGGQALTFNSTSGTITVNTINTNPAGRVDFIEIHYNDPVHFWVLQFSTQQLVPGGAEMLPGTYQNAERPMESAGHPGLSVFGDGRGANQDFGSFTVVAATYDYSGATPTVTNLSIDFVQHAETITAPVLTGTVNINYSLAAPSVPSLVLEQANEGTDTVQSSVSYTLPGNVENLTLTGTLDLTGTGNDLDNVLTSNTAVDTLSGGRGNDTYVLNNAATVLIENPSEGSDTVTASFALDLHNYANVENVTLSGAADINATGDGNNNVLTGNAGANALSGDAGDDTLVGNAGDDTLDGGAGNDTIRGGSGADTLSGGAGSDTINGGASFDTVAFALAQSAYQVQENATGTWTVTSSEGTTTLASVERITFGDGGSQSLVSAAHASNTDFDGDGRADILWRNVDGRPAVWLMNGLSTESANVVNGGVNVPNDWKIAGTGDFDGDGRDDILWRHVDGRPSIWAMNEINTQSANLINGGVTVPTSWAVAGTGDFDGDGKADILWRNADGTPAIWEMNGLNTLAANVINGGVQVPTSWAIAGTGDFNGDGNSDILWRNADGTPAIWEMSGLNTLAANVINGGVQVPTSWRIAGTGDFNGDGNSDILWRNADGTPAIWEMNGLNTLAANVINGGVQVPNDWKIADVQDYNGDGRSDILWRNDDGRPAIWEMNGLATQAANVIDGGVSVPNDWLIA